MSPFLLTPSSKSDPLLAHRVWTIGKLVFRSDFDSGNCNLVQQVGTNASEVQIWTRKDCEGSEYEKPTRTWFYFGVKGHAVGDFLIMTIMNMNKQGNLYKQDYRPWYWTQGMTEWQMVSNKCTHKKEGDDFELRFSFKFGSSSETFFAFAIPFSYEDNQSLLSRLDSLHLPSLDTALSQLSACSDDDDKTDEGGIYYRRQLLASSLEGRRVDLLTITDHSSKGDPEQLPSDLLPPSEGTPPHPSIATFPGRKVFFVSSRVHPGESPATHMFNGLLELLLRKDDARAIALRREYVFKLVPIVNPDGVFHGNYRTDTLGQNLNRYYLGDPNRELQPSVWAIKRLLLHYASYSPQPLEFYIDLHAHANKKGVFIYGNALEGEKQLASLAYSRLVALNSPAFDFQACNYTEKNMKHKDKEGESKEGAGRVALFKETRLLHLYTCEANYNMCRAASLVPCASGDHGGRASPPSGRCPPPRLTAELLQSAGRALVIAALDLQGKNPWSRLPNSTDFPKGSPDGVRAWLLNCIKAGEEAILKNLPPMDVESIESCLLLERAGSISSSSSAHLPGLGGRSNSFASRRVTSSQPRLVPSSPWARSLPSGKQAAPVPASAGSKSVPSTSWSSSAPRPRPPLPPPVAAKKHPALSKKVVQREEVVDTSEEGGSESEGDEERSNAEEEGGRPIVKSGSSSGQLPRLFPLAQTLPSADEPLLVIRPTRFSPKNPPKEKRLT